MRIFCIHPNSDYNIGDMMTYRGMKYLLKKAFGSDVEFLQFDMRRSEGELETYVPEYNWGDGVDIILIGGIPWVSDDADAHVLHLLRQARTRWPGASLIALGIGSFFRYKKFKTNDYVSGSVCPSNNVEGVVEHFRDFDLILTRDIIAHDVLLDYGIGNTLYYDMSVFSCLSTPADYDPDYVNDYNILMGSYSDQLGDRQRDKDILVYGDPQKADVWAHLPPCIWDTYRQFQYDWAVEKQARVVCISSTDQGSAQKLGLKSRLVTDLDWMAWLMSTAASVLTTKVHQAILASIMGCPGAHLMPIDSRYTTVINAGVDIVQPTLPYLAQHPDWNGDAALIAGTFRADDKYLFPVVYPRLTFNPDDLRRNMYTEPVVEWLKEAVCLSV